MNEYQKNQYIELTITDIGVNGEGIGHIGGYAFFVTGALPKDRVLAKVVKVKSSYAFARMEEILEPSPDRAEPPCPVYNICGGCQLQALAYAAQLRYKEGRVTQDLIRLGKIANAKDLREAGIAAINRYRYRNKALYPIRRTASGTSAGFFAQNSHRLVHCEDCLLCSEGNQRILREIIAFMEKYGINPYDEITGKGDVRNVLIRTSMSGDTLVCIVINSHKLKYEEALAIILSKNAAVKSVSISVNTKKDNVVMGKSARLIYGEPYITEELCGLKLRISAKSFFQVNTAQAVKLYETVRDYIEATGVETLWDLYCGTGTIGLFLSKDVKKVIGVEAVSEAVKDAKGNAASNGIKNAVFIEGNAEDVYDENEKDGEEIVVIDPPRKGCDKSLLEKIIKNKPERIVYVSCDSATFARDVEILGRGGYSLMKWKLVDQFVQTVHVECVGLLTQRYYSSGNKQ